MQTATPSFVSVDRLGLKTPRGYVFKNLSFSAEKGQIISFFGGPGSGKTAMLLSMCGRMKPTEGNCYVATYDINKDFRHIRHMSQISFIPGLNDVQPFLRVRSITAAELALVGKRGDKKHTDAYLKSWNFYDRLNIRFDDLKVYDRNIFGIILAMTGDPDLLIVDDLQADLTQHESIKIAELLKKIAREKNITIFFGCSEYDIADHADGLVVVSKDAISQRNAVIRDNPDLEAVPIIGYANDAKMAGNNGRAASNAKVGDNSGVRQNTKASANKTAANQATANKTAAKATSSRKERA